MVWIGIGEKLYLDVTSEVGTIPSKLITFVETQQPCSYSDKSENPGLTYEHELGYTIIEVAWIWNKPEHFNVWYTNAVLLHTNVVLLRKAELQNEQLSIVLTLLFIATGPLSPLTTSFSMIFK